MLIPGSGNINLVLSYLYTDAPSFPRIVQVAKYLPLLEPPEELLLL